MANLWLDRLLDVALSPALWLSVVLAFGYSTLFTVWSGTGWRWWPRDVVAGVLGFALGQGVGMLGGSQWLRVGDVQLLWGTVATLIALVGGRWLHARLAW